MAYSNRTIGIIIASAISIVLIIGAVLISGPLPFKWNRVSATSTHDLLVSYASKDTDADGLPDWQEALYATDPNDAHSVRADILDGQAVAQGLVAPKFATATTTTDTTAIPGVESGPDTLTDQFARELFTQYVSQAGNSTPTPETIASFVEQAVANLTARNSSVNEFDQSDVKTSGTGEDALLVYAAQIEGVFAKNTAPSEKSEIEYLADAVQKNDKAALKEVKRIGATYTSLAKGYVATAVPSEAVTPHLEVANALARIGTDITDFSMMDTDPLRAYFGLAKYQEDVPKLVAGLKALNAVYTSEGVVVPEGTSGFYFFRLLTRSATQEL